MELIATKLKDFFIIKPTIFEDERGYFFESFNEKKFNEIAKLNIHFVQDNQAMSHYGTVRGLHFQNGDYAQAKLVSVVKGKVIDVAVDMRPNSETYLQHIAVKLSGENKLQLFVPRGFAHGYSVLKNNTIFQYKCDNYYNKASEGGIYLLDKKLNIDWKIEEENMLISEKDRVISCL